MENDKIKGGKADKLTPEDLAKKHGVSLDAINKEIKIGIEIEYEHTNEKELAKEISMDHIEEFPDYYSNKRYGLKASEKKLKGENITRIKTLLRENFVEDYEKVKFLITDGGDSAGVAEVKIRDNYRIELTNLDLADNYNDLNTANKVIRGIFKRYDNAQRIFVTPKEGTLEFWEKLGGTPLNSKYWIIDR